MPLRTKKLFRVVLLCLTVIFTALSNPCASQGITLYTPYTKISVPPGETIDYSIDVINNGGSVRKADITLEGLPKEWTYTMKSGGWSVGEISVLPREKKNFSLQVQVPLKINKGAYHFQVVAKGITRLPLTVFVSEQGTFKTEFTTTQPNMEGAANSTFTFNGNLRNRTADNQVYSLVAQAPPGWNVIFKANYKQVSSVSIEANHTQDITIEVKPPEQLPAGKYKIPVLASTNATSADLNLEVVITGSYAIDLTTPQGLLSTDVTAGDSKRVELVVRNSGSAELKDVDMQFSAPTNWDVVFEPKKIASIKPGTSAQVFATIKAPKKAISGDYVVNLEAKTAETSSKSAFRVSVETSLLSGWLGILIILAALGSVYYLFRKYGRR